MKKILIIATLLITAFATAQTQTLPGKLTVKGGITSPYINYVSYTTSERNALSFGANDRVYIYNSTDEEWQYWDGDSWETHTTGGGATTLTDLTDVSGATATNRFVLVANGSTFVSRALTEADISDLTHTVDTDTQLSDEEVQDKVGAMFTGNTETLATVTYQDADGTIDVVVDNDLANYSNATSNFSTGAHTVDTTLDIASSTEVNTGTNDTKAISPLALANSTLASNVATNNAKVTFPGFTSLLADYSFTDNSTNWNTAFGWGNHSGLYVGLTGAETVNGIKTFGSFPVTPSSAPTSDYQVANKKYVDDEITAAGGYNDEAAQDAIGTIITDTSEIDFTYNDGTPSITASIVTGSIDVLKLDSGVQTSLGLADSALQSEVDGSTTNEIQVFDVAQLNGNNLELSLSSDSEATKVIDLSSLDTNTQLTQEQIEDFVGAMVSGNTETLIAITYNDTTGKLNFVVDNDLSNYDNSTSNFSTGSHFTPTNLLTDYSFTDNSSNWNTAFSWGNHASQGYLTSEVDGSTSNELQTLDVSQLSGTNLELSLSSDGEATKIIDLSSLDTDTTLNIATTAEINTGTVDNKAISPLGLENSKYKKDLVTHTSGLSVNVKAFVMYINEVNVTIPAETITLPASTTHYIGYDLVDYSVHYLRRNYQDGMIWVAKVTTDGSTVTDIEQITPILPCDKIPAFREKLVNGTGTVNVALLGDSLVSGGGAGNGVGWDEQLFDSGDSGFGYNVPSVSNVNYDDYASGGQTSRYGTLWTAKSTKSGGDKYNATGLSYDKIAQQDLFQISDFDVLRDSPLFTSGYDLVIIGFGANGGTYDIAYFENIIKNIRERGIEVIIISENYRTDNASFMYDEGNKYKVLANAYGCAYADTWSFVRESDDNGNTVHHDTIHMAEAGKTAYANAIRTIINDKALLPGNMNVSKTRIFKEYSQVNLNKTFPNASEFDCNPMTHDGTRVSSSAPDTKNPVMLFGGFASSSSIIELEVGEIAKFSHAYASAVDVVIDGSMVGEFDITIQNGGSIKTSVQHNTNQGNRPELVEGITMPNYISVSGSLIANKAVQIECTSGTVKLYGLVWHTYKNETLLFDDVRLDGTFSQEAWHYQHPKSIFSDTVGDAFTFEYTGSDCVVLLGRRSAGGIVDVYLNGELYIDDEDLYSSGNYVTTLHITTATGSEYDVPPDKNMVTIVLDGVNVSAATPTSTNRRLSLLMIKQLNRL